MSLNEWQSHPVRRSLLNLMRFSSRLENFFKKGDEAAAEAIEAIESLRAQKSHR